MAEEEGGCKEGGCKEGGRKTKAAPRGMGFHVYWKNALASIPLTPTLESEESQLAGLAPALQPRGSVWPRLVRYVKPALHRL